MSKKVLVIDDPKVCRNCLCFRIVEDGLVCEVARRAFRPGSHMVIFNGERFCPEWCPLKTLPEYKMDWSGEQSYESGWNDVLDLIGGDEV